MNKNELVANGLAELSEYQLNEVNGGIIPLVVLGVAVSGKVVAGVVATGIFVAGVIYGYCEA